MTEIVKNNNSMTFDLLETGSGGANSPEAKGVFNALFGGMGTEGNAEMKNAKTNSDENDDTEIDILSIANMLTESDLNLSNDILEEIRTRLKKLFEKININGVTSANNNSDELNSLGNKNFIHIMTFLEELESLIKLEKDGADIHLKLDPILNQIRIKLNEQVKAAIEKTLTSKDRSKINTKIMQQEQKEDSAKKEVTLFNKDNSRLIKTNPNEDGRGKLKSFDLDAMKKPPLKNDADKILSSKPEHLNISQNSVKKVDPSIDIGKKISELKMDSLTQNFTNSTLLKDLNSESNLVRPPLALTNKLEGIQDFETSNIQKPLPSNQENNDRLLQTLNMLSKKWGNSLIEKIEKSIEGGIEQLEIQLTPKSLGRLNVIINIHDTVAKINIIAESANAAALLGDAESKLSQMMEVSGLRLASLQTQTNQFGGNHKGKEQGQKLASTVKKANIEDSSKPIENIDKKSSANEGLNLIA